jgi:predicted solute-binding protein
VRIALWDIDLFTGLQTGLEHLGCDVNIIPPGKCAAALKERTADIALVPSPALLADATEFRVLPGVAFGSRSNFPYVSLHLNKPLVDIRTITSTEDARPFLSLASVVLREQYDLVPKYTQSGAADAELVFGNDASVAGNKIDIGVEWYELAGNALPWAFFAMDGFTQPNKVIPQVQHYLREMLLDEQIADRLEDEKKHFVLESLSAGYGPDLADGVDQLAYYLYYVGVIDDIPAVRQLSMSERPAQA